MFDIGFSELLVIGIVALIVIGPERLPRVARTLGHLAGRMQRYVADVKADINREIEFEELRRMRDSVQQAASSVESSFQTEISKTESELNSAAATLAAAEVTPAPEMANADAKADAPVSPAQEAAPASGEQREPTAALEKHG
ncbi:MAG: twin arginine-targeting protein translocase TatB [Betaproteobacteria bacterium RIFCSPLOWO2_02_FULL_68_150]|nr:MAG: twin arginine-targeting protein translocase TatB [Betaproteobacteria bacterium RIFCSPLOWO2_02_FULL_68_150]